MDARTFLAEFGHIASAPGGVARLREFVLQLAISGRLVPRCVPATPVSASLAIALEQRREYEVSHALKTSRPSLKISKPPYPIPAHWEWVRLEQVVRYIQRGKSPEYADHGDVRVVSQKCVHWSGFNVSQARFISDGSVGTYGQERFLCDGDVLWNSTGTGTVGRASVVTEAVQQRWVADSHVTVIRPSQAIAPRYLWCVLAAPWVQSRIHPMHPDTLVSGTTQQVELATSKVRSLAIPLPPVEEQALIVAKVDELMALCDRLEVQHNKRLALQNQLRETTLSAVATAQSQSQLKVAWARAERDLAFLVEKPEHVSQFQDAAFNLALHGYLNPSSQLTNTATTEDEGLSPLPLGWRWDTLEGLSDYITSGSRGWKAYLAPRGDAFIRSQDIKHDALIFENPAWVALPDKAEGTRTLVRPGDILLTITGGNVGKCAVVPLLSYKGYVSQHVALIRLNDPTLAGFLHFWMTNAYGGRRYLSRYIYGDKPGLNLTQVGSVPVPVPPPEAVEEILKGLRTYETNFRLLEKQLRSKEQLANSLATAAVSALTGISAANDEDDTVKAPQTELIAPLCLGATPDVKELAPLATILARHQGEMSAKDLWQRFGGEIDVFYAQLKTEVANGWIREPAIAEMREVPQPRASA